MMSELSTFREGVRWGSSPTPLAAILAGFYLLGKTGARPVLLGTWRQG
jgi:hypothetical protein